MSEPNQAVFVAMAMPQDEDEPVLTRKVGTTPEAAKAAVIEATTDMTGLHLRNFEWEARVENHEGWRFVVKQKGLHGGSLTTVPEDVQDTLYAVADNAKAMNEEQLRMLGIDYEDLKRAVNWLLNDGS